MALDKYFSKLKEKHRYEVVIELLTLALPIWNDYINKVKVLEYRDTVVGMYYSVEITIIEKTIELAKSKLNNNLNSNDLLYIKSEYSDPIVALQDLDWELPYSVECIFYAAYNLIEKISGKKKSYSGDELLYLVSNQTIDALTYEKLYSFEDINNILMKISK